MMNSLLPIIFLFALLIGFLIFLLLGRKDLAPPPTVKAQERTESAPQPNRPDPIPEDPENKQNILLILENNAIFFEKFGKLKRVYGQLIYGIRTNPGKETQTWEALSKVLPAHGYWPVFVSSDNFQFSEAPEELATLSDTRPEDAVRIASKYPLENFLTRIEDWLAFRLEQIAKGEYWGEAEIPAPEATPDKSWQNDHGSLIAFIPTPHPWQVPAYFLINDSLSLPENETLAVLRHWEKLYSAKLFFFTKRMMVLKTNRRPESKEEALQLAYEHMDFCGDLFKGMYTSPEELAADLMRKNEWDFQWQ